MNNLCLKVRTFKPNKLLLKHLLHYIWKTIYRIGHMYMANGDGALLSMACT